MPKLTPSFPLPLKEDAIRAAGRGKNEDFWAYMRTLIKKLSDMYQEIANAINQWKWGSATDYSEFEADGTLVFHGTATVFRDELNDLLKTGLNNPDAHIVQDLTEGTLDFKTNCDLNDWALMNVQINHDWLQGSAVEPHVHWFQNSNATPNWLMQYRWQKNGQAKTTAWTSQKWTSSAYAYSAGTLDQITSLGTITPPANYHISDILQIRLLRDNANGSTLFAGADAYTGDAEAVSLDVHIECNKCGSRTRYAD